MHFLFFSALAVTQDEIANEPADRAIIHVGTLDVLTLENGNGILSASERAAIANSKIEDALLDPSCGPDQWQIQEEYSTAVITLCSRRILEVTAADSERAKEGVHQLAIRWEASLRNAFTTQKQSILSSRLLHRALLGLIYPLIFLGSLWLIRLLFKRLSGYLLNQSEEASRIRIGKIRILAGTSQRQIAARFLSWIQWLLFIVITYLFFLALFRQFPLTMRWAREMTDPLQLFYGQIRKWGLLLIPRCGIAVVILVGMRFGYKGINRLFAQVRVGKLRFEPILSKENAASAELVTKGILTATGLFLLTLLVPGEPQLVLIGGFGLVGFALAYGARQSVANFWGGLVLVFVRPIRTNQEIRTGDYNGVVREKTIFHLKLETKGGMPILLPNSWFMNHPVKLIKKESIILLRVTLEAPESFEKAVGLFRHAAAKAGLKRENGKTIVVELNGKLTVFDIDWLNTSNDNIEEVRSNFILSLQELATGLGTKVVTAQQRYS